MRPAGVWGCGWRAAMVRLSVWANRLRGATIRVMTKVLIADDHAGFRQSAGRLLEAEGYEVVGEAADGAGAIAEARRLQPDLVLLDIQLPDEDGFEVAAEITAFGGGDGAPAVVLTSSRDWSDSADLIRRSGARGFVPKSKLSGEALAGILG